MLIRRKWKMEQYTLFSQHLANLLESGIPLVSCLELLSEQNMISDSFCRKLVHALQAGQPLSMALKRQAFPDLYISFIRAAEEHGNYVFGLKQCEQYYMTRAKLVRELFQACLYPLIVLGLVGIALTFMITMVLPRFSELYQTMGIELPWITMGLFYFFDGLRILMFSLIGCLLVALIVTKFIQMQPKAKRAIYTRWVYRLPVMKPMVQFWMTHYLSIQLGSLLQAGVPLLQALNLVETLTPWSQLSVRVSEIKAEIMRGVPLYQSIQNTHPKLFLPSLERMVAIGEKTGRLDEMLLSLAHGTEQMIKNKADRLIKSLEPILIFFIGVMIAVTVIAMFLPMLQLVKAM